jgi:hypothetical protein
MRRRWREEQEGSEAERLDERDMEDELGVRVPSRHRSSFIDEIRETSGITKAKEC